MLTRILIIVLLFCFGKVFGQNGDTLYLNSDTLTLKEDTINKNQIHTIIFRRKNLKVNEESTGKNLTDWGKVSSITQIIGTALVFMTLIFLGMQIRIANRQAKIATKNNILSSFALIRNTFDNYNDAIAQCPDLGHIILKARQSYVNLAPDEKIRFDHVFFRLLNSIEAWYILLEDTKLSHEFKKAQEDNINAVVKHYFNFKGAFEFWETYKAMYIPEMQELILANSAIPTEDKNSRRSGGEGK